MSKKVYQLILQGGVYLAFISIFLVWGKLLFPFITSKQIYFNVLMEIMFVIWLVMIFKYPEMKPKKSYISFGLLAFFVVIFISSFLGVDTNLSIWGDVERMLGVFHVLHFLIFYLIIITVFRTWFDWKILFIISIVAAFFLSLNVLATDPAGRIGNRAYVAGYLIFNIYFTSLLFIKERDSVLRLLFLVPLFIFLPAFQVNGISGAYVGLISSVIFMLFLYTILAGGKKIKIASAVLLIFLITSVSSVFSNREHPIIKDIRFLEGISDISFEKNTFQTRFLSWQSAAKDFPNHPFFGTGYGNFAITFDKYFDPTFYEHTRSETYFDRAHNNLIDIVSTSGSLGLLTYLFIFFALAYYLIIGFKKDKISIHEFILISSLVVAYFVQNLAVFDSLVTYISLMLVLAYVYWLSNKEEFLEEDKFAKNNKTFGFEQKEIRTLILAMIVFLPIIYFYNFKPIQMLTNTIESQRYFAQGEVETAYEIQKKALSYNTVLDRDSRSAFLRSLMSAENRLASLSPEKRNEILKYGIEQAQKNIAYNPNDSIMQMQLAMVANMMSAFNKNNEEIFSYYSDMALKAIDESIAASPGRVPIYFVKAQIYSTRGENEKAIETIKYSIDLNPRYYDSTCQLARYYLFNKEEEKGMEQMNTCIDLGGSHLLTPNDFIQSLMAHYNEVGDTKRLISLYNGFIKNNPNETRALVDLSRLYYEDKRYEQAIRTAERAMVADPSFADQANSFIEKIKSEMMNPIEE